MVYTLWLCTVLLHVMQVGILNSADFEDGAGGSVSCSLYAAWENLTAQREVPILYGCRKTSTTSYPISLLLL